ncbi:MAG TPA: glucokinase [Terricaulis sp.]|nr:glucokinase [Terricaulis sp.]
MQELVVGEVVGVRARIALIRFESGQMEIVGQARFERGDSQQFEERIRAFLTGFPEAPREAAFAVGGPVEGQHARITSDSFVVSARQLQRRHGFSSVLLKNDFVAMALGSMFCPAEAFSTVAEGAGDADSAIVTVGPNAGLGMAILQKIDGRWQAFESEGGHQAYAACDLDEMELWRALLPGRNYITFEDVISAEGVCAAYRVFAQVNGERAVLQNFEEVVAAALAGASPAAVKACQVVARSLATFAGDACLAAGARAGVVIAGALAKALAPFLHDQGVVQRFRRRGPMTLYVADIPVRLLEDDTAVWRGLAHAVRYAEQGGVAARAWPASAARPAMNAPLLRS